MILISHRGNIQDIDKDNENTPDYINNALCQGYDVEIDVFFYKKKLYLGHDEPKTLLPNNYLYNNKIWFHAKNIFALNYLLYKDVICFGNDNDNFVLTSNGFIWTWNTNKISNKSIIVLPEKSGFFSNNCSGICSDYIKKYKY